MSDSLKSVSSAQSMLHLFGNSLQHAIDACFSNAKQDKDRRRRALEELPSFLREAAGRMLDACLLHETDLRERQKTVLSASGHDPEASDSITRVCVDDLPHLRGARTVSPLVANLIHAVTPNAREWATSNQAEWLDFLREEMSKRSNYRTKDRHQGKSKSKGELLDFYFRAPPWLAEVVGAKLEKDDVEAKTGLFSYFLKDFADEFSQEAGVDVIGIAVHRERDNDLHVHLVCSEVRETIVAQKYTTRELKDMVSKETKLRIARRKADKNNRLPTGRNKVRAEVENELKTKVKLVAKYVRIKRPRPWRILGPAFRGKLELYLASGRNAQVASLGDDRPDSPRSFRSVVVGKDHGELQKTYVDLWGTTRFCDKLQKFVGKEHAARIDELKKMAVESYLRYGTSQPSIEDFVACEFKRLAAKMDPINSEKLGHYEQIIGELADVPEACAKDDTIERIKALKESANNYLAIKGAFWELRDSLPLIMETLARPLRVALRKVLAILGISISSKPAHKGTEGPTRP